jgi:hypothetical protein
MLTIMLRTSIRPASLACDRYLAREASLWTIKSDNECVIATLDEIQAHWSGNPRHYG